MPGGSGNRSSWSTVAAVLGSLAALITAIVGITQLTGGKDKPHTNTSTTAVAEGIYSGSSGGQPGFTFTVNGSEVSNITGTWAVGCTNRQTGQVATSIQSFRSFEQTRGTIGADGGFSIDVHLQSQVFRMNGKFEDGKASGSLSWVGALDASGRLTSADAAVADCATGEIGWSANV
jgi:hypothetical protein